MSLNDVLNKIVFWDSSNQAWSQNQSQIDKGNTLGDHSDPAGFQFQVKALITELYNSQSINGAYTIRNMLESVSDIKIGFSDNNAGFANIFSNNYIGFNAELSSQVRYIDQHGTLRNMEPFRALLHEFIHYATNTQDIPESAYNPNLSGDLYGATVNIENNIVSEMGLIGRSSYGATISGDFSYVMSGLSTNQSYSNGNKIDIAYIGNYSDQIIDSSTRGISDDLLFGQDGNDTITGGSGNDYLYGGEGILGVSTPFDMDTSVYRGRWIDYAITEITSGFQIADQRHSSVQTHDGTDRVYQFERFAFQENGQTVYVSADRILNTAPVVNQMAGGHGGVLNEGFYTAGTVLARFSPGDLNEYDTHQWDGGSYTVNVSSFVSLHMLADGTAEARLTRDTILDYETWLTKKTSMVNPLDTTPWVDTPYAFSVTATDYAGLSNTLSYTLNILDLADDATFAEQTPGQNGQADDGDGNNRLSTLRVNEGQIHAGAVTAIGSGLTYSISSGPDSMLFDIDQATGAISFKSAPDFEVKADAGGDGVYDFTVRAIAQSGAADERQVRVVVDDLNLNTSPYGWATGGTIAENSAAHSQVGRVTSGVDFNGNPVTFSLLTNPGNQFAIDAITGIVTLAPGQGDLDYEAGTTRTLKIGFHEQGSTFVASKDLIVNVTDVNEGPPPAPLANFTLTPVESINENMPAGTVVATVTNISNAGFFMISGPDAQVLEYHFPTNTVRTKGPIDFETIEELEYTVIAFNSEFAETQKSGSTEVIDRPDQPWTLTTSNGQTLEDTAISLGGLISFTTDVDSGTGVLQIMANQQATFSFAQSVPGLTVNNGPGSITMMGSATAIKSALTHLKMTPEANFDGTVGLTVFTQTTNPPPGNGRQDVKMLSVQVEAVADAPLLLSTMSKSYDSFGNIDHYVATVHDSNLWASFATSAELRDPGETLSIAIDPLNDPIFGSRQAGYSWNGSSILFERTDEDVTGTSIIRLIAQSTEPSNNSFAQSHIDVHVYWA